MIYAVKFREKGEKQIISALFEVKSATDFQNQMNDFINKGDFDIDKRTISWSGNSVPLKGPTRSPLIIYSDLDETT